MSIPITQDEMATMLSSLSNQLEDAGRRERALIADLAEARDALRPFAELGERQSVFGGRTYETTEVRLYTGWLFHAAEVLQKAARQKKRG